MECEQIAMATSENGSLDKIWDKEEWPLVETKRGPLIKMFYGLAWVIVKTEMATWQNYVFFQSEIATHTTNPKRMSKRSRITITWSKTKATRQIVKEKTRLATWRYFETWKIVLATVGNKIATLPHLLAIRVKWIWSYKTKPTGLNVVGTLLNAIATFKKYAEVDKQTCHKLQWALLQMGHISKLKAEKSAMKTLIGMNWCQK